ncbi:MAG: hypothetical protein HY265_03240, partial [Deltaproteobacteria bacterium]|nr:hypothetical protein [Deltaproteobacteria bacterium]
CLYCHDGNRVGFSCAANTPCPPDIWGPTITGQTNPSGGSLCSGGTEPASPPCTTTNTNHTVDVNATVTVPGSSPAITFNSTTGAGGFTCVNCHNPHGTTSYRNLRDNGTSYAGVTFMAASDTISYFMGGRNAGYYVNNLSAAGFGLAKYETSNVVFKKAPTTNTAGIQGFCKSCHTLFHGASGDTNMSTNTGTVGDNLTTPNPWLRHPTRDTSIGTGATNLHADSACWTAGTTAAGCAETFTPWDTTPSTSNRVIDPNAVAATNTGTAVPFCLTCHRAHGSTNHSNLIFGPPTSVGGAGTMMRQTCQQCHNQ